MLNNTLKNINGCKSRDRKKVKERTAARKEILKTEIINPCPLP
jgi:hypothetical protein